MYRSLGKAGGLGGGLAATGAPNVALTVAVALACVVVGVCLLRTAMMRRQVGR